MCDESSEVGIESRIECEVGVLVCYEYFTSICMNEGVNRVCSYSVCMFSVSTRDYKGSEFYYVLYMMKY